MTLTQSFRRGTLRKFALATFVAALCAAASAQAAGAAVSLQASTTGNQAGAPTFLTLQTVLSGGGNAQRQYGAAVSIPKTLHIKYSTYGTTAQMCSGAAIQPMSTGFTPAAYSFDPSSCPATAEVGTVALGASTGKMYLVNTTPMPSLGLYFDTNVSTPYGLGMQIDYSGGFQVLRVNGLPNTITTGLKLWFENPSRPGGLQTKLWNWTDPDDLSYCQPNSNISGGVYTYPTSGTAATGVAGAPKALTTTGCGVGFKLTTEPGVANATTTVKIETPLTGAGNDVLEYGTSVAFPPALFPNYMAFGSSSQMCSGASVQPISTGYTPAAKDFDISTCPATALVGTATLGSMSGGIYTVNTTPVPSFGVWFDTGVTTPFGRALEVNWTGSAATLSIAGLPNTPTTGLVLDFNNPSRPTLPAKTWRFAQPGTSQCANGNASNITYLYPPTFTAATETYPLTKFITITGC